MLTSYTSWEDKGIKNMSSTVMLPYSIWRISLLHSTNTPCVLVHHQIQSDRLLAQQESIYQKAVERMKTHQAHLNDHHDHGNVKVTLANASRNQFKSNLFKLQNSYSIRPHPINFGHGFGTGGPKKDPKFVSLKGWGIALKVMA
jgi:hypothetical protein